MQHLHYDFNLDAGDCVQVKLDKQANVRLMDDNNYRNYRRGGGHNYYGGRVLKSPIVISAPHAGHWHLAIDLGGYAGKISASVNII